MPEEIFHLSEIIDLRKLCESVCQEDDCMLLSLRISKADLVKIQISLLVVRISLVAQVAHFSHDLCTFIYAVELQDVDVPDLGCGNVSRVIDSLGFSRSRIFSCHEQIQRDFGGSSCRGWRILIRNVLPDA